MHLFFFLMQFFSNLSYTYFHSRKCIFLQTFFFWKVVKKSNMYTNTHQILVLHTFLEEFMRFEKSATELKQSKLLKCKQTLQISTFNVRTLNRIGQLPELIASAEEHKIDIICIQEHRYTHTEDIKYHETGNGWSLATVSAWKNSVNAAVGGVGLLIGPRALKTLNSVEKIQPRMMVATFNGNPRATIISCYSPTNVSEENELVTSTMSYPH